MADINWSIDLPEPIEAKFGYFSATNAFPSPLTQSSRTVGIPGQKWLQSLRFNNMILARSGELEALLMMLEGQANRLVMHRIARPTIRGSATAALVMGGAQTGGTIQIDGMGNNVVGAFQKGDMVGVGGELKMVVARIDTNGSGQAALQVRPVMRNAPADNSAIVITRPTARWMLADPTVEWTELLSKIVSGHALDLVEDFAL